MTEYRELESGAFCWTLTGPDPDGTYSFEDESSYQPGMSEHLYIAPSDVSKVIAFLGGEQVQGRAELEAVEKLMFRPDGPRPVWRNKHTGKEVVVLDLTVDDNGGFQGGCRRFVVVINEDGLPWKPTPDSGEPRPAYPGKRRFSVTRFLEHWEPAGESSSPTPTTPKGAKQ